MSTLDSVNPSLTRYRRNDPAPVLPLREEPDLLSWLETSGRLVADEDSGSPEVSTVEEESSLRSWVRKRITTTPTNKTKKRKTDSAANRVP